MHEGVIQQAEAPLQTYHWPRNRFVAGFIGMPPMNFFDGTIMMSGGDVLFEEGSKPSSGGFSLPVPARLAGKLGRFVGQSVVLGVRPEHFSPRPVDRNSVALNLKVNVVEPLGNDMDIYMSTNLNDHVVARVESESAQEGSLGGGFRADAQATLYVDLRKVHFFEPGETGMNLSLTNETDHAAA
jgi:multiple sugar transport system ATP-binding protein